MSTEEYVSSLYDHWLNFSNNFNISYDSFYRTSDSEHIIRVQNFWNDCVKRGDIYKKKYKGHYCVGCESFKTERDLINGKCPDHENLKIQLIEEENYFFKLSNYKDELKSWVESSENFLKPKSKLSELNHLINDIEDISISRLKDSVNWGVPVPNDESQTIYVWFDALLNYIFAAEYESSDWWNDVIQICGPDNLRFQAVIFQGILASAKIKKSDTLIVHGTILDNKGRKISKSLGNGIDPLIQLEKYGIDAVKYYSLAGLNTFKNSSWDEERLVELFNSHIVDGFGNIIARVSHLAGLSISELSYSINDYSDLLESEKNDILKKIQTIKNHWKEGQLNSALLSTNKLINDANQELSIKKPWKDKVEGWSIILKNHFLLNQICDLYEPIFPEKTKRAKKALLDCEKEILFSKISYKP